MPSNAFTYPLVYGCYECMAYITPHSHCPILIKNLTCLNTTRVHSLTYIITMVQSHSFPSHLHTSSKSSINKQGIAQPALRVYLENRLSLQSPNCPPLPRRVSVIAAAGGVCLPACTLGKSCLPLDRGAMVKLENF